VESEIDDIANETHCGLKRTPKGPVKGGKKRKSTQMFESGEEKGESQEKETWSEKKRR
jgi:hypothetical protein